MQYYIFNLVVKYTFVKKKMKHDLPYKFHDLCIFFNEKSSSTIHNLNLCCGFFSLLSKKEILMRFFFLKKGKVYRNCSHVLSQAKKYKKALRIRTGIGTSNTCFLKYRWLCIRNNYTNCTISHS